MAMNTTMGTAIRTAMTMTTDAAKHLRLQSWFSPAFPIGAFSYSHGLEWAVEEGTVTDRTSLIAWLDADLRYGSGRADAIFFAQAWRATDAPPSSPGRCASAVSHEGRGHTSLAAAEVAANSGRWKNDGIAASSSPLRLQGRAATQSPGEGAHDAKVAESALPGQSPMPDILAVAALAAAMRGTAELALESGQQGIAFLAAVRKAWPHPELDRLTNLLTQAAIAPVLPIAAGICCAVHGIGLELALPFYVHGSAANLVNAAVRLVPLGQTDGQIALAALEEAVLETAREAAGANLEDAGSAAFMIDIASMRHETQYTRLFRS